WRPSRPGRARRGARARPRAPGRPAWYSSTSRRMGWWVRPDGSGQQRSFGRSAVPAHAPPPRGGRRVDGQVGPNGHSVILPGALDAHQAVADVAQHVLGGALVGIAEAAAAAA